MAKAQRVRRERPAAHLSGHGILQADGHAGFEKLDGADSYGFTKPLSRLWQVKPCSASRSYTKSKCIRSRPPANLFACRAAESTPRIDAMHVWLKVHLDRVSGRSQLTEAIR